MGAEGLGHRREGLPCLLDRVCTRLATECGREDFTDDTLPALVDVAAQDPGGFRLLFQHAAREPEFPDEMTQFRATMTDTALAELVDPRGHSGRRRRTGTGP